MSLLATVWLPLIKTEGRDSFMGLAPWQFPTITSKNRPRTVEKTGKNSARANLR
jgi:hypothetical protein